MEYIFFYGNVPCRENVIIEGATLGTLITKTAKRAKSEVMTRLIGQNVPIGTLIHSITATHTGLPDRMRLIRNSIARGSDLRATVTNYAILLYTAKTHPDLSPAKPCRISCRNAGGLISMTGTTNVRRFIVISSLYISGFFRPLGLF